MKFQYLPYNANIAMTGRFLVNKIRGFSYTTKISKTCLICSLTNYIYHIISYQIVVTILSVIKLKLPKIRQTLQYHVVRVADPARVYPNPTFKRKKTDLDPKPTLNNNLDPGWGGGKNKIFLYWIETLGTFHD